MYLTDVGDTQGIQVTAWPGAPPSHPQDIVCVVRQQMSSRQFHQIALLVPGRGENVLGKGKSIHNSEECWGQCPCFAGDLVPFLRERLSVQPVGDFPRKAISQKDQHDIISRAEEVHKAGQLTVARPSLFVHAVAVAVVQAVLAAAGPVTFLWESTAEFEILV